MSIDEECAKARERREEIECSHLLVCWREREREWERSDQHIRGEYG